MGTYRPAQALGAHQHTLQTVKTRFKADIYRFSMSFSVLVIALFIYYTSVSAGTEARTEVN